MYITEQLDDKRELIAVAMYLVSSVIHNISLYTYILATL